MGPPPPPLPLSSHRQSRLGVSILLFYSSTIREWTQLLSGDANNNATVCQIIFLTPTNIKFNAHWRSCSFVAWHHFQDYSTFSLFWPIFTVDSWFICSLFTHSIKSPCCTFTLHIKVDILTGDWWRCYWSQGTAEGWRPPPVLIVPCPECPVQGYLWGKVLQSASLLPSHSAVIIHWDVFTKTRPGCIISCLDNRS